MSSFKELTKHPETKQFELATWIDDYFGEHNYGIIFDSSPDVIHDSRDEVFKTIERDEFVDEMIRIRDTFRQANKNISIIKTHIEANTENNMISLEARLAVNKELNELLEEIK